MFLLPLGKDQADKYDLHPDVSFSCYELKYLSINIISCMEGWGPFAATPLNLVNFRPKSELVLHVPTHLQPFKFCNKENNGLYNDKNGI